MAKAQTVQNVVRQAEASISNEVGTVAQLAEVASKHPYYKFNFAWTRAIQDTVCNFLKGNEDKIGC